MRETTRFGTLMLAAALSAVPACEEKPAAPKDEPSSGKDGGLTQGRGVDKNLAEAVRAVAEEGQGGADGPPATGVFGKGAADKALRPGSFPALTVGGKGSPPLVTFVAPSWKPGKKRDVTVTVSIQTGPTAALPTVDVTFTLEASAPAEGAAAPSATQLQATVSGARLAAQQPGQLPPGLAQEIAKVKGCKVRLEVAPSGGGRILAFETAPGLTDDLAQIPKSAADSLALSFLPFPAEPVGAGGFWMVASREPFVGLDVLAYRMMKLEKVEGERAQVSVSTKRYVAGGQVGIAGIPPHEVQEFSGNGGGQMLVPPSDPLKLRAEVTDALLANLSPQGGGPPGQRMGLQLQIRSVLSGK